MADERDRLEYYRDTGGAWRWRRLAPNGRNIANGGESFSSAHAVIRAALRANLDLDPEDLHHANGEP